LFGLIVGFAACEVLIPKANKLAQAGEPTIITRERIDAQDLLFDQIHLRNTIVIVSGVILCTSTAKCIFQPPPQLEDSISLGISGMLPMDQKEILLERANKRCPTQVIGFFSGTHVEVSAIISNPNDDCSA